MVFVIPELTSVLEETGAQLPLSTRIVMAVSNFLSDYILFILIALIGGIFGFKKFLTTNFGKLQFDKFKVHLPLIGNMFKMIYIVRFTRSLSTLLKGGVTITKSLEICAAVVGNKVYQNLINDTLEAVRGGDSVTSVFEASQDIPGIVPQLMIVGEKIGNLDAILDRIAAFYSKEVSNTLANLMTILEPVIMVVMAVGVGIMIAAVILPMYNLASQF
jgi:type IV pilus assembly protein PilC